MSATTQLPAPPRRRARPRRGRRGDGWSVRTQLLLLVAGVMVAVTVASGALAVTSLRAAGRGARTSATFRAGLAANAIADGLGRGKTAVAALAARVGPGVLADPARCALSLELGTGSHIDLVRPDGRVVCSSLAARTLPRRATQHGATWLTSQATARGPQVSGLFTDRLTGRRAVALTAPVRDDSGRLLAVAALVLPLDTWAASLGAVYGGPQRFAFTITDRDGRVLSPPPAAGRGPARRDVGPAGAAAVVGPGQVVGWRPVPGLGWRVYASRSTAAVLGPTRVLLARETGLTAAALLVLGAMLVVVNRRIARPLAALTRAVGLAGGQDAPAPLPASGPSEVRRLAAAFNQAISARARSEQQLRDDREQLRLWARQLPAVLWSTDRELRLQQVAGSAVANLTRPVAELTGRVVAESLAATAPDRARSTVLAAHQRALAGEAAAFELELAGRTYQAHVEPFRDDAGQVTGTVGLALDLHDRWRAEAEVRRLNAELERRVLERTAALAAANAELDAFSYSVSHDLRAPLHTVSGFAQALLEDAGDQLDATAQEHLGRIQAASAHMGQLIDGLLRLSRAARSPLRRARVDLSALVAATADDLRRRDPGRAVEVHVPAGIVAWGDAQLLAVAVENLLGNAWKFTGKHPTAKIQFGADDGKGEPAFFVRDDGAGFDPAYADKLFGAFQRLHAANQFDGSGIGLATVQRIVARHGGRVWAEGLPEQGATFWFTLGPADTDEERPS